MLKKIRNAILRRDLELRERIFRIIILLGSILVVEGLAECIFRGDFVREAPVLLILLSAFAVGMVATFKYRRIDFAAGLLGVIMLVAVFPLLFLQNGALDGGSSAWFALGLVYVCLMFQGKKRVFFIFLSIASTTATYAYAYLHPAALRPLDSMQAAYLNSWYNVIVVGLTCGIILVFHEKFYEMERQLAEAQKEELEKVNQSRNIFFASMSHEIRTPINTIVGLNEMILRETGEQEIWEYARNMQSAGKMLMSLVNDILDLSQMEVHKMEIVPVEYETEKMFRELIEMIQVKVQEKKLELIVDIDENLPSVLCGDVKRVQQVFLNLLSNAVKYTNEGSVTLLAEMESLSPDEIWLKVSVADTGIGIRKEDLEYLYDAFRRVDNQSNARVEGSGLGLAISKQLVDMMSGEISVDSIYAKGSTFCVKLPQKIVRSEPMGRLPLYIRDWGYSKTQYQQSFEAPEARVLIVDDNEMNSMVAVRLLAATKMQIDQAGSGEECLELTRRKYYHVILLDYMMPGMDGIETLNRIRKQENGLCRDSAVIALTADTMNSGRRLSKENSFDGFLEKPIQSERLESEILRLLPEEIIEYRRDELAADEQEVLQARRAKKRKIYITTDCVSDLPDELLEKYDIGLMYLYIKTERGRFADTREIDSQDFTEYLRDSSQSIKADSVSVEEYEEFFSNALNEAEEVVHVSMAANAGRTYQIATTAATGFNHVRVVDSGMISCGQALVVLHAARLASEGCSAEMILASLDGMKKHLHTAFFLPDVKAFYLNGHTGRYKAKLCEMFHFRPILRMHDSRPVFAGVQMGSRERAIKRFIHYNLLWKNRINTDIIYISHVGMTVREQEYIRSEVLKCVHFKRIIIQKASVTTSCSSGVGSIGLSYYLNP